MPSDRGRRVKNALVMNVRGRRTTSDSPSQQFRVSDAGVRVRRGHFATGWQKSARIFLLYGSKWFAVPSRVCKVLIGKARSSLALPIKITLSIASTQMQV